MTRPYDVAPSLPPVDPKIFAGNRSRLVSALKHAKGKLGKLSFGMLFVLGGDQKSQYDTDKEELFRQESNFHWLFGAKEADLRGVINLESGKSTLLIPRLPESYAVWIGSIEPPQSFKERYGVDDVRYVDEAEAVLTESGNKLVHVLSGVNTDSGSAVAHPEAKDFPFLAGMELEKEAVYPTLVECRVIKTPEEIALFRYVNKVSSAAHVEVMQRCKPGITEYQLESLFLHSVYAKGACRHVCYTCICASGPNGALLHYPNNDKTVRPNQMLLMDMGAEYNCYCSDITTSFPSDGKFTPDQRAIYTAVLEANLAVQRAMKPGVSWTSLHELSYLVIAEHLVRLGILVLPEGATVQTLVDADIMALFMPHGLGHFLGHNVHDVGGYPGPDFPARSTRPGFSKLRTARTLAEGMLITVEPGCYFVKALLVPALADPAKSKYLNASVIERFMDFGGVRIEDNIHVTKDGAENLTIVPRSIEDVERVMAGGSWDVGTYF